MAKKILRIVTAGSVDDGKSTLLARLLLDTKSIPADQIPKDISGNALANLLDGLDWEREQGITIDVAHRYFDMESVRYHLLDSPGHEQYTRNMVTAASGADLLLLLVGANEGIKPQTLSHLEAARLMGVENFVIAINKFDLVKNRAETFKKIKNEFKKKFNFSESKVKFVGIVATTGENVVRPSRRLQFEEPKSLLQTLEGFAKATNRAKGQDSDSPAVVSIQLVLRENQRLYLASVLQGTLGVGEKLRVIGSNLTCTIADLYRSGQATDSAGANSQIAFTLESEVDLIRGDVLSTIPSTKSNTFMANLVWLDSQNGIVNRRYFLQVGNQKVPCRITKVDSSLELSEKPKTSKKTISMNSIDFVEIATNLPVAISTNKNLSLNKFILVDPVTAHTIAAGHVVREQRRSQNIHEHEFQTDSAQIASRMGLSGKVVWFTGLSGSGKSTIADALAKELAQSDKLFAILDGDSLRKGINKDLGFSDADRVENIRRTAEIAKILSNSGIVAIVALVSPFAADRQDAREIIGPDKFIEVFVDTPIEICEKRDPKGLYKKARSGQIPNFTGIGSSYEPPKNPEITIDTLDENPKQASLRIFSWIFEQSFRS